jgi:hypothetical protein
MIAHSAAVLSTEVSRLQAANILLSKRKERKRKVLKGTITISVADGLEMGSQLATAQSVIASDGSAPQRRRCGRCRQPGHRITTCKEPAIDAGDPIV